MVVVVLLDLSSVVEEGEGTGKGGHLVNGLSIRLKEIKLLVFLLVVVIAVAEERRRRQHLELLGKFTKLILVVELINKAPTKAEISSETSFAQREVAACSGACYARALSSS